MSSDHTPANAAEELFWNAETGQTWVELQEPLDATFNAITQRLYTLAAASPGEHVLDVGCGTGATTMALARSVGADGSVVGLDISRPMLARAEARTQEAGLRNIRYMLADAQTHGFAANSFDLVASRFGVMFFADPVAAFANLRSGLRARGRLACACWAAVARNPWFHVAREAAVARLGQPTPTAPTAPGPMAFADVDYVRGILAKADFADIAIDTEEVDLHVPHDADWMARVACRAGPANRVIRHFAASADDVALIRADIAAGFARYETPSGVKMPATLNFLRARNH